MLNCGLLKANNIVVHVVSEGISLITGEIDGQISQYNIFVPEQSVNEAQKLLASSQGNNDDRGWKEYRQKQRGRGILVMLSPPCVDCGDEAEAEFLGVRSASL